MATSRKSNRGDAEPAAGVGSDAYAPGAWARFAPGDDKMAEAMTAHPDLELAWITAQQFTGAERMSRLVDLLKLGVPTTAALGVYTEIRSLAVDLDDKRLVNLMDGLSLTPIRILHSIEESALFAQRLRADLSVGNAGTDQNIVSTIALCNVEIGKARFEELDLREGHRYHEAAIDALTEAGNWPQASQVAQDLASTWALVHDEALSGKKSIAAAIAESKLPEIATDPAFWFDRAVDLLTCGEITPSICLFTNTYALYCLKTSSPDALFQAGRAYGLAEHFGFFHTLPDIACAVADWATENGDPAEGLIWIEEALLRIERAQSNPDAFGHTCDAGANACRAKKGGLLASLGRHREATELLVTTEKALAEEGYYNHAHTAAINLGAAHAGLDETGPAIDALERALAYADRLGNKLMWARAEYSLAAVFAQLERDADALTKFRRALRTFVQIGTAKDIAGCKLEIGICLDGLGEHEKALRVLKNAEAAHREIGRADPIAICLEAIARCLWNLGRPSKSRDTSREAFQTFCESGDFAAAHRSLLNAAIRSQEAGEFEAAIELLQVAIPFFGSMGYDNEFAMGTDTLAACFVGTGHYEIALDLSDTATEIYQELGLDLNNALALATRAEALAGLGRRKEALATVNDAYRLHGGASDPESERPAAETDEYGWRARVLEIIDRAA